MSHLIRELRKWEQAYLADAIDVQDLKVRRAEVTARRTSLGHEMVHLDDQQRLLEQVALDTASVAGLSQGYAKHWYPALTLPNWRGIAVRSTRRPGGFGYRGSAFVACRRTSEP